ncbi:ABC transporter permease [Azospirillum rugosum]|uniref:Ribose transport system permease protein n=3 Tax=Azospirillum rugosum TaxID=416170 RepID=A0ABS4SL97_9PROT|nr:ABC transporter permease [Azospirillum rugosum]MBP2293247.1 ribose transport system permease protein [Azospirillum rugosum]
MTAGDMTRAKGPHSFSNAILRRITLKDCALPTFIVLLAFVTGLIEPRFWATENLLNLSRQIAPLLILSVGQAFAVICGGLDLSIAANLALSGVYGILVMNEFGVVAGVLAMLLSGTAVGFVNGFIITRFQVSPLIVTLGMLSVCQGLALMASGGLPIYNMPDAFIDGFGYGSLLGVPTPTLLAVLTLLAGWAVLRYTVAGRYIYAIGSKAAAAYSSGIDVRFYSMLAYTISGLTAGIGAIVLTAWVNSAQPLAGAGLELRSVAAVVLGGIALTGGSGSMLHALYGAIILGMLSNSLNMMGVSSFMQTLVIGLVIVTAVILDKLRRGQTPGV